VSQEVHLTDTTETLLTHLFTVSAENIADVITNYVNGKIPLEPQDEAQASYTKLISKEDGLIDIKNPPSKEKFDRMVRAYYPWPGVWTRLHTHPGVNETSKLIKFLPNNMIQIEGKNPVSYKDFLNGHPELREKLKSLLDT
jgi:methionyl-tRNA formyltransferase